MATPQFPLPDDQCPSSLSLRWSEVKGNGWIGRKNLTKVSSVLSETPLALALFTDQARSYCSICFVYIAISDMDSMASCDNCSCFVTCSSCASKKEEWDTHGNICDLMQTYGSPNDEEEGAYARIFLHALRTRKHVEEGCEQGSIDLIEKLIVNEDGINTEVTDAISHWTAVIGNTLHKLASFKEHFNQINYFIGEAENKGETLSDLLTDFYKKLVYNWHAIPADNIDDDDIGYAIYPFACFFNHSCSPNVSWRIDRSKGATFYATSLKDIAEGEEVFISYFGDDQNVATHRRKEYLADYYQFNCDCSRCSSAKDCYLCEAESRYICSTCKNIKYCSAECQKKHWRSHKRECVASK